MNLIAMLFSQAAPHRDVPSHHQPVTTWGPQISAGS
jgi:hypothetical protein